MTGPCFSICCKDLKILSLSKDTAPLKNKGTPRVHTYPAAGGLDSSGGPAPASLPPAGKV